MIHKKSATASRAVWSRTEVLIRRIVQENVCSQHAIPTRDLERKLGNQILKQASSSEVLLRLCSLLLKKDNAKALTCATCKRRSAGSVSEQLALHIIMVKRAR